MDGYLWHFDLVSDYLLWSTTHTVGTGLTTMLIGIIPKSSLKEDIQVPIYVTNSVVGKEYLENRTYSRFFMYMMSIDARSSLLRDIAIDNGNSPERLRGFGHAPLSNSFLQTPLKFFLTAKCNGVSFKLELWTDGFAPRFSRQFTRTCIFSNSITVNVVFLCWHTSICYI